MSTLKVEYNGATLHFEGLQAKGMWELVARGISNLDSLSVNQMTPVKKNKVQYQPRKSKQHTAKLWTQEEYDQLIERNNQLQAGGLKMRSKRVEVLAKEFKSRTPIAILSRLQEYEAGKPFKVKNRWGKVPSQPQPADTNQVAREFLTADPHGEIDI